MTNSINQTATVMVFNNSEFGNIRISLDGKGEPLFCGKDVCEVLGYRRTADAVNQHVDISDSVKHRIRCEGLRCGKPVVQYRSVLFVTESGFYALVLGSKLDTAQKFKHWVTAVVLPQIRKTGGFVPLQEKDSFIAQQKKLIAEQETEIDRLLPKALYADNVLDSISCYTTTQIAKELGMTAQELNRLLCAERVQYYQSGQYMLYAEYAHRGLAKSRTHFDLFVGRDTVCTRMYLVWTEKGRKFIHQKVKG